MRLWVKYALSWWSLILTFLIWPAQAALQFDVFVGYDGVVREAGWFPVACEVLNDGPSFNGIFELTSGTFGSDQVRRVPMELPTNTRKRFVIPVFASGNRYFQWNARLLDDKGKVRGEHPGLQPKVLAWEGLLLGAMPKNFSGLPSMPDFKQNRPELKPEVARLQPEQFPDNPIALEGLDALYLNSEKALALKVNQIAALLAWVQEGGHLILSVEQLADINATPWLSQLVPCELSDMSNVPIGQAFEQWLGKQAGLTELVRPRPAVRGPRRLTIPSSNPFDELVVDPTFALAEMPVATGRVREGRVLLAARDCPLLVQANRGRGQITLVNFSPEREPFRSWKNRSLFWAKLLAPSEWYLSGDAAAYGGSSIDGVFGALIDSRQLHKLPVEWLLLLLVVYLVVIGPFDQYWLKKINRQMLTWITFPTYVVLFSLLIYFIGYKLRAGETEWNELSLVDLLPRGQKAALRGRTYTSIYSSANARYQLAFNPPPGDRPDQAFGCLRGELLDFNASGQDSSRAAVDQQGNGFRADLFVPVWTSLLYVSDWMEQGTTPLTATLSGSPSDGQLVLENLLDRPLTDIRVAWKDKLFDLSTLPARTKKTYPLNSAQAKNLPELIAEHSREFQDAVQARRRALGDERLGHLENPALTATIASFCGQLPKVQHQRNFVAPPGLDLSPLLERGDAVVLAWDASHSYLQPLNQFKPPRLQRNSLLRLAVPLTTASSNTHAD